MAKPTKTKSGKWRVRVYLGKNENGTKKYKSITCDTKKECEYEQSKFLVENNGIKESEIDNMFITDLVKEYIDLKKGSLSPNTIRGYLTIYRNQAQLLNRVTVSSFDKTLHQRWVDCISSDVSPKTVRNADGLIIASLNHYGISVPKVKLPQKEYKEIHIPTTADVKAIINYFYEKNNIEMVKACYLASTGTLRRGEVCALLGEDVDFENNTIFVHRSVATDDKGNYIIKGPKTESSNRKIEMPSFIIQMLPRTGNVVNLTLRQISRQFSKCIEKLGIRKCSFHSLRHYAASIMHAQNIPEEYIMQRGGWKSSSTLNRIYRNTLDDYERSFTKKTNDYFEKMFN